MYLHPLIHTEFTRRHEAEISRRALRAARNGDGDRQPLRGLEPRTRIRRLIAAFAATALW